MLTLKSLASSSAGNCHLLTDGVSELLLDCGVRFPVIREWLDFNVSRLSGILLSHLHGDHSKAIKDFLKAGVDCFMGPQTAEGLKVDRHHRAHVVEPGKQFKVGPFNVLAFPLVHDVENFGYLVELNGEKSCYITDSQYVHPQLPALDIMAIEVNYCLSVLRENVERGILTEVEKKRIVSTHFGLSQVIDFLKANDLSKLKQLHLLHASDRNSDIAEIEREVARLVPSWIIKIAEA